MPLTPREVIILAQPSLAELQRELEKTLGRGSTEIRGKGIDRGIFLRSSEAFLLSSRSGEYFDTTQVARRALALAADKGPDKVTEAALHQLMGATHNRYSRTLEGEGSR